MVADGARVVQIVHLLYVLQHVPFLCQAHVDGFAKLSDVVLHPVAPWGLCCCRGSGRLRRGWSRGKLRRG